ncbi:MAG: sigma-70 family RNA polymerase sigma factor [Bacteroidetes bacterium]|nr:MAG: sigma-70 family RNA polymerase sigma factor [Bacteroidota bacterium]
MKPNRSKYSNEDYLNGIRQHDSGVLQYIFKEYLPLIEYYIISNKGTKEAAEDIFMDALEAIYRKVKNNELKLTCAFYTFLFAICKNLWYKKLRGRKYQSGVTMDDWEVLKLGAYPEEAMVRTERFKLYREKFNLLGEDCKKILHWFLIDNKDMKEIASLMGFKSEGYARKRKFQCKQKLTEMIKNDDRFEELIDY